MLVPFLLSLKNRPFGDPPGSMVHGFMGEWVHANHLIRCPRLSTVRKCNIPLIPLMSLCAKRGKYFVSLLLQNEEILLVAYFS